MKYKTTATVTLRQQNGGDAGKVQSGFVFESNTSRMIRDALHRKIEDGAKLGLYVPASACAVYVEPEPEPSTDDFPAYLPVGAQCQMRFKIDGEWTPYYTFQRID